MRKPTRRLLVCLAYLGFISLGLPDGLLGVAWPSMRAFFGLPVDALGMLLVVFTSGYLLSSLSSGKLLARMHIGALLAASCLATGGSLLGFAFAPAWWCLVMLSGVAGLGAGAIDAGLNIYAATHFNAAAINWLHAFYGLGAMLGPVLMTHLLETKHSWQAGYMATASAQLLLACCFLATHKLWTNEGQASRLPLRSQQEHYHTAARPPVAPVSTLRLPVVRLSASIFFLYTGIEAAAGAWSFSLFTAGRALPTLVAGTAVSFYWGSLTVGRLLSGFVVRRVPVRGFLCCCFLGIALGATLLWCNFTSWLSFAGLAVIGLCCAPIFPTLIAATPEHTCEAHTANAVGLQIAAAVLGQAFLPALIGWLAKITSLEVVPPALLLAALLALGLYQWLSSASAKFVRESTSKGVANANQEMGTDRVAAGGSVAYCRQPGVLQVNDQRL